MKTKNKIISLFLICLFCGLSFSSHAGDSFIDRIWKRVTGIKWMARPAVQEKYTEPIKPSPMLPIISFSCVDSETLKHCDSNFCSDPDAMKENGTCCVVNKCKEAEVCLDIKNVPAENAVILDAKGNSKGLASAGQIKKVFPHAMCVEAGSSSCLAYKETSLFVHVPAVFDQTLDKLDIIATLVCPENEICVAGKCVQNMGAHCSDSDNTDMEALIKWSEEGGKFKPKSQNRVPLPSNQFSITEKGAAKEFDGFTQLGSHVDECKEHLLYEWGCVNNKAKYTVVDCGNIDPGVKCEDGACKIDIEKLKDVDKDGIVDSKDKCIPTLEQEQKDSEEKDPKASGDVTGSYKGFISPTECAQFRCKADVCPAGFVGAISAKKFDSDGDGLSDDDEDTNRNCKFDVGVDKSDWANFDTDYDGISDYDEVYNGLDPKKSDTDYDGIEDGMEDRRQINGKVGGGYQEGYLWHTGKFKSLNKNSPIIDTDTGNPVVCNISFPDLGVSYNWYIVSYVDSSYMTVKGKPVFIGKFGSKVPDPSSPVYQRLEVLACKAQAFSSPLNFNGFYEKANYELDPKSVDTDKDGYCDNGCGDMAGKPFGSKPKFYTTNDNCPLVTDITNKCSISSTCIGDSVFYSALPAFVVWEKDGAPKGWKYKECSDIPLVIDVPQKDWKQILVNCPVDTDGDGIPDCVENPDPAAACKDIQGFKYFKADSDGDGLVDGWKGGANSDVCPITFGKDDSCDPTKVYLQPGVYPIISCFMDRDGDGLRDCEEDTNMNGKQDGLSYPYGTEITSMLLKTIETDPLKKDTDGDGLSDFKEITIPVKKNSSGEIIYTNPSNADTDGDYISDGAEDRDGLPSFSIELMTGMNSCANLVMKMGFGFAMDTDPTEADTDGDGLTDFQELLGDQLVVGVTFLNMLSNPGLWPSGGGIQTISNPRSKDSDGDGLEDAKEYSGGKLTYVDSNPCMLDSDGDGILDGDEYVGCALNKDTTCKGTGVKFKDAP